MRSEKRRVECRNHQRASMDSISFDHGDRAVEKPVTAPKGEEIPHPLQPVLVQLLLLVQREELCFLLPPTATDI